MYSVEYKYITPIVTACQVPIYKLSAKEYAMARKIEAMATTQTFANWLEEQLKEQNISQSELARRAGVTRGAINNILQGQKGPGVDLSNGIARALDLPEEIVLRVAGLLPPDKDKGSEEIKKIVHELQDLPKEEQEEFLSYVRWLKNRRKKK
jgi:transcriptional regulator with XRE-family HTH domain